MTTFIDSILSALKNNAEKTAIIDNNGERKTTYAELYTCALQVAEYIRRMEIPAKSCITISLPKSMEYFAAEIGCWLAGHIVVPMSNHYPKERVDYIQRHCESPLCIDANVMESILSNTAETGRTEIQENVEGCVTEDDIVALFYTSGSTGTPKGVMHSHKSFADSLLRNVEMSRLSASDVVANSAPMYFIVSIFDYATLSVGGTLHIYSEETRTDVQLMSDYILHHGITVCFMSPTVLAQYSNPAPTLRLVLTGSERLTNIRPHGFDLINVFGQTETAGVVVYFHVDKEYENTPIGRPSKGIELCLLDEDGKTVADGEEGEICLKGNLTPGYYKDEERTSELWQNGWLHTGDIGCLLPDGNLLYVNRKDWMVKISGQRVEPGEVETVMKKCPGIKDAIVKGFQNKQGKSYLCGFYIADTLTKDEENGVTQEQIETYLKQYLPEYMIPSCYSRVETFPLNANGKTDRKSLLSPLESHSTESQNTSMADGELTETEKAVKAIVAELLKTEDFTKNDNLGYLGLTSVLSTKLASAVYKKFDVQLDVRTLVKNATVSSVARDIDASEKASSSEESDSTSSYSTRDKEGTASLTYAQQGVYVDCMNNPDSMLYNLPFAIKMPEGVTAEQLDKSLRVFVAAHPFINCCFVSDENGDTVMKVREDSTLDIPVKEMSGEDFLQEKNVFIRPFNLEQDILYRFEIINVKSDNNTQSSTLYLLVDFHHLISDGGSMDVFFSQLAKALEGAELDTERYDYYHFAHDQHIDEETETFFEQKMSQIEEASQLIPDVYDPEGGHRQKSLYVATDLCGVEQLSRRMNITPASIYLGAMALTVSKYVAEDIVGLCTISNGRSDSRIAENMGMFVNTLPLVCNVDSNITVEEYLQETADNFSSTIAHENYPFARINEKYGFADNIMFAYQVDVINSYHVGTGTLDIESLEQDIAKFPIAVFIEGQTGGKAEIHIDYDADLFSEAMMQGFAASLNKVLSELLKCKADGDKCKMQIKDVEVCNEEQILQLGTFNAEHNPVKNDDDKETVIGAFQKVAKQYPDNIAAVFKDKKYTYKELDELTDRIGAFIQFKIQNSSYGLASSSTTKTETENNSESVVSILIPRNEYMFILPLAAMKAGCAYQPLDPSYPQERLNFMVKDANAALLIADPDLRDIISEYEGEVILTSELGNPETLRGIENPDTTGKLTPSSLFILLYTSGSTGVPKGVMLEHQNLLEFIRWYRRYYGLKPEHNVAAYASFGFDACMMDMYPALTTGATVHIVPEEIRLDLVALNEYFEANNITHSFMTTQVGVQFLQNIENHSLLHLSVGGEKLVSVDPAKNFTFHNGYGPTECTIFSTTLPVVKREPNIPIGKPTDALKCFVTDKYLHRLPAGAAGELIIVGKQVGRGYLNRPDKTAEAFFKLKIEDGRLKVASADDPSAMRAYHSGDIVRYRQDGNIEFVGRKDGQVKIRGFRIELKEVEAVIREFPGVKDVTVQAFDDPNGGKYIAAYVVNSDANADVDIEALNQFILDRKPPYMVPAVTMQIDKIPLNVNQKVDKKALPKPEKQLASNKEQSATAAPLNTLEVELKAIIASVVNTEEFGITDILGFIGLTSISSIKLATLIYKKYGVQVNAKTLAKTGTLQSIENEILQNWMKPVQTPKEESLTIGQEQITKAPLTFAQTGVYYDIVRTPGSMAYNMPTCLIFPKGVSVELLREKVMKVIASHPILGTHFEIEGKDVVQVYPQDFQPEVRTVTVEDEKELETFKADFVQPFNPATGPLYRAIVVKLSKADSIGGGNVLLLDFLHLVMDGASLALFQQQLVDALDGKEPVKEDYTYFDYAAWEKTMTESTEFTDSEQFFTDCLKTVDGVSNITEDLKPSEQAEARLAFAETPVDFKKVEDTAKLLGVTPANIFLAAAYYTVSRYTNTPDVCLCTISNGRSNLRVSDTVGMFVNTIAVTSHINDTSVRDFIQKTAHDFSAAIDHENYPFARVAEKWGITPSLFFQYQIGVLADMKFNGGIITMSSMGEPRPKFKFTISIESVSALSPLSANKDEGGAFVQIQYDDTLYSQELCQGFADSMVAVITHFLDDTDASLQHISMLTPEQAQLISTFHQTKQADVPVLLYHKLFEKSVAEHNDEIALVALNPYSNIYETFTYARLNEHMNRIAHSLIERGVQPRDRVALLLPRTSRFIMSQYGVLKTGAAYIPCDPKYPTERINLILEDSESRYIITTKDRLEEFPGKAIDVEELLSIDMEQTTNPDVDVQPDDLAYLIYTSGSTGRPKGVQLMHKGVCNYHHPENLIQSCLKNECHAALGITTISFDMSVWETGSPLMLGKTLVFVGDDDCNDPNRLAMLVNDYGIDCMTATTSRFMQLLESPAFEEAFSKHIHLAYQGGEGLSMALLRKLQSYPNVRIFNGYGPTETIANSHASELTHDNIAHIGKPCVNYTNYIIDNDGNELPVGVVGELVIGGRSVAKGYNNLPEQTAARFVKLKTENGRLKIVTDDDLEAVRVYKSGDYARWLPDGNVMVLGRKDNQVKLRGLRIELGEVESAITKVEGVKNVAVMIKKLAGKDHLCAYFTADRNIEIEDMKAEISKTLTHYMVPTAYLQMEAFPLTPNGKTDVKHLPEPVLAKVGGNYVSPRNKAEEDFCNIFATILEQDKVSAADSFFDLGGSSLTATRVVIEATNLGYTISYAQVFENPTAQKLARVTSGESQDENIDPVIEDYDYTKIDKILSDNTLESFRQGEHLELGDVILTGANGYLGIHILHELLENYLVNHPDNKVYCLVRHGRNGVSSESRLRNLLFYYFDKNYKQMFGNQLIVIDGDVTDPAAFDKVLNLLPAGKDGSGCTLVNCAAIVKHFSEGTEIEDINIGGLQNCVDFCVKTGAHLIQTSTNSTAGEMSVGSESSSEPMSKLDERHSYIGQIFRSKYTRSKFLAERIMLEAVAEKGLVAKVVRLGNLSPRATDGEFQINFRSNSSMGRLHIFQMLGVFSYSINDIAIEFSPIDEVAKAVLMLAQTPRECVVFHPVNNHYVLMGDVIREMASILQENIYQVEDDVFSQKMQEAGQDPEKAKILQSLLAYLGGNDNIVAVEADNSYTNKVLNRMGFNWNVTSWDYVHRFVKAIAAMNFFEAKR